MRFFQEACQVARAGFGFSLWFLVIHSCPWQLIVFREKQCCFIDPLERRIRDGFFSVKKKTVGWKFEGLAVGRGAGLKENQSIGRPLEMDKRCREYTSRLESLERASNDRPGAIDGTRTAPALKVAGSCSASLINAPVHLFSVVRHLD